MPDASKTVSDSVRLRQTASINPYIFTVISL